MLKKVLNIAKLTFQMTLVMLIGFAISLGVHISVSENTRFPTESELRSLSNISEDLDSKEASIVKKSRGSILHVLSGTEEKDGFTQMSGTYVTHDGKFYVITAGHGIVGDCAYFYVATSEDNIYDCIKYVAVDKYIDYAIIEIEKVTGRIPIELTKSVPKNNEWRQEVAVLNEVFYTGYPNSLGPLTFRGSVAGVSGKNYIYLHSYAWPGSSGSGVFSYDGNMIGIVIALNVGFTGSGYDVIEDLVIVTPLFMIDWDLAYEEMEKPSAAGDTGDTGE